MGFPNATDIFGSNPERSSVKFVRDTVARPSLDTFYEVDFSFGKSDVWLGSIGKNRTQSNGFMRKMSLLCSQAEIPGTSFVPSTAIGHHQGIQEEFPNLRNFPPLNLVFYCDADQVIIQVLESWMSYINPIFTDLESSTAYSRFNYPDDYKEDISITKFERDSFVPANARQTTYKSHYAQFKFKNVWPSNLTSMRVAYGDSNVLRCAIQFAYDRFHTRFNYPDTRSQVIGKSNANSKEIRQSDLDFDDPNRILNRGE